MAGNIGGSGGVVPDATNIPQWIVDVISPYRGGFDNGYRGSYAGAIPQQEITATVSQTDQKKQGADEMPQNELMRNLLIFAVALAVVYVILHKAG